MCFFLFFLVCKEPPYKVEESGYAGFIMPIEVHFKNKVGSLRGAGRLPLCGDPCSGCHGSSQNRPEAWPLPMHRLSSEGCGECWSPSPFPGTSGARTQVGS